MRTHFESPSDSRFWTRLKECEDDKAYKGRSREVRNLIAAVGEVTSQSKFILDQIVRYLPQYTLHNDRHMLNVLGIMEMLVPDEVIDHLAPLECALCILAAYIHDLGMALTDKEYANFTEPNSKSPERRHFLRFREQFAEEHRQLMRLQSSKLGTESIKFIEASILAAYIREAERPIVEKYIRQTHSHPSVNRINHWLERIKESAGNQSLFIYGNFSFQHHLSHIGISHNMPANWLRNYFSPPDKTKLDCFCQTIGHGERINFAFPGLLLRLADIMDFDATRAPRILYQTSGINDNISKLEWSKHLSITGWDLRSDDDGYHLFYAAQSCPDPVTEKCIRLFGTWIEAEIRGTREELDHQRRLLDNSCRYYSTAKLTSGSTQNERYQINLPSRVSMDVNAATDTSGRPVYIYNDLQFRLDHDAIQHLLMGESLYGDPGLCIRELVQNALDAVELREFRLKLQAAGGKPREPVDQLQKDEVLGVTVTWGCDAGSGKDFIRVSDNGVGMTQNIIEKYFVSVGKSYYTSPDYIAEQFSFSEEAIGATSPISRFGIGILSCFMLSEHIFVRTRPGGSELSDRASLNITINGPGSLFWISPGTLDRQGTEITLFLKPRYHLKHDPSWCIARLRKHFSYPEGEDYERKEGEIDPAYHAAAHVIWPRHPVKIVSSDGVLFATIDDRFHSDVIAPISKKAVVLESNEWGVAESTIGDPSWINWDWFDNDSGGTGSRVRFWFPYNYMTAHLSIWPEVQLPNLGYIRQEELASFVEPQLENTERTRVIVHGMHIRDDVVWQKLPFAPAVGTRIWIDLRGRAVPRLTADRRSIISEDIEGGSWQSNLDAILSKCSNAILDRFLSSSCCYSILLNGVTFKKSLSVRTVTHITNDYLSVARFNQSLKIDRRRSHDTSERERPFSLLNRERASERRLDRDLARGFDLHADLELAIDLARQVDERLARSFDRILEEVHHKGAGEIFNMFRLLSGKQADFVKSIQLLRHFQYYIMNISWNSNYEKYSQSWPLFRRNRIRGLIGNASSVAPAMLAFDLAKNGHTLTISDKDGQKPEPLIERGYDLCLPLSEVPLGNLRRTCATWRTDRRVSALGVAPFLIPEFHDVWRMHTALLLKIFRVRRIFALMPCLGLWYKNFNEWCHDDWRTCGYSAVWEVDSGRILWTEGAHHIDEMSHIGQSTLDFFQ